MVILLGWNCLLQKQREGTNPPCQWIHWQVVHQGYLSRAFRCILRYVLILIAAFLYVSIELFFFTDTEIEKKKK